MRAVLVLLFLALAATPAAADPVTVVSGPKGGRDDLVASIAKVRSLMGVCWQRKAPASIKITLAVAASGEVTKAAAKTKGAAAQCAAGILAVSTLSPPPKAWKGVVAIEPTEAGKGKDVRAIHDALAGHSKTFYACQKKAADYEGKVTLRVTVAKDGAVTAATAEADAAAGKAVATCVAAAAKKLTLDAIENDSVTYELTLAFAGGETATAGVDTTDPALQPSKKGPLEPEDLMPVISARRASMDKCAKGTKARGKVVIRIAIADDGKVSSAKVKTSELDDTKLEGCLIKVFRGMSFREAGGETVVLYPILLDDKGQIVTGG